MMKKYIQYLQTKAKGNILSQGLGDWYDLGPKPPGVSQLTPMGVTATAIYYSDLKILGDIADLLNKKNDAIQYKDLAAAVRTSFNDTFFHKDTKQYASGSQTANAMAVHTGLVEPADKKFVIENIVKDIRNRNMSLTAGDIGYHFLLSVLHDAGRDDVIYDMNSRTDVPGYGYQLANGATALTESWAALPANSNNHFMLGHLMEWFYTGLGGIRQSNNSIAFKEIIIDIRPVNGIDSVAVEYDSPYGVISSKWRRNGDVIDLHLGIPANTTAIVYLPSTAVNLTHRDEIAYGPYDVRIIKAENQKTKLAVRSGNYHFSAKMKKQ